MDSSSLGTSSPPPSTTTFLLAVPVKGVLVVTINRPQVMNSIPAMGHWEAHELFSWFDKEPTLSVAIITGAGPKAFCAGQDLVEQNRRTIEGPPPAFVKSHPPGGFAALSRRVGRKPVIAAVNGFALGGGFEICLNCDLVLASPTASFGLPEIMVGIYAGAGGLARVVRNCGYQIASEISLLGRRLTAEEAKSFFLVNTISKTPDSLMDEALAMGKLLASFSPDAVFVTRQGLREAWETGSVERATQITADRWVEKLMSSENTRIGLKAFAEKKKPAWVESKL